MISHFRKQKNIELVPDKNEEVFGTCFSSEGWVVHADNGIHPIEKPFGTMDSPAKDSSGNLRIHKKETHQAQEDEKWSRRTRKLKAYKLWKRLDCPTKRVMIAECEKENVDLTPQDVDLLPWIPSEFYVDLPQIMDWVDKIETLRSHPEYCRRNIRRNRNSRTKNSKTEIAEKMKKKEGKNKSEEKQREKKGNNCKKMDEEEKEEIKKKSKK